MQIHVKHEIPDDLVYCCDGDSGGWSTMCGYYQRRNKTGKRGTPIQRGLPRCSLFGEWLEPGPRKCPQCLAAMTEEDAEEQGLLVRLHEGTTFSQIRAIMKLCERINGAKARKGQEVEPMITWQLYNILCKTFGVDEEDMAALKETNG